MRPDSLRSPANKPLNCIIAWFVLTDSSALAYDKAIICPLLVVSNLRVADSPPHTRLTASATTLLEAAKELGTSRRGSGMNKYNRCQVNSERRVGWRIK